MLTKDATLEQAGRYLAALEEEKAGYEARIARAKAGRVEPLTERQLADRVKQVTAEIARVKRLQKKAAAADGQDGDSDADKKDDADA